MAGSIGETFKVEATATFPPSSAEWKVDLGEDPELVMLYTNLGYDLIGAAMAKRGVEFSKYVLDGDRKALEASMTEAQEALKPGLVSGPSKK